MTIRGSTFIAVVPMAIGFQPTNICIGNTKYLNLVSLMIPLINLFQRCLIFDIKVNFITCSQT